MTSFLHNTLTILLNFCCCYDPAIFWLLQLENLRLVNQLLTRSRHSNQVWIGQLWIVHWAKYSHSSFSFFMCLYKWSSYGCFRRRAVGIIKGLHNRICIWICWHASTMVLVSIAWALSLRFLSFGVFFLFHFSCINWSLFKTFFGYRGLSREDFIIYANYFIIYRQLKFDWFLFFMESFQGM